MNKNNFIKAISERKGIGYRRTCREVNDVIDTLRVILLSVEEVQLGGFGTFEILINLKGERIPVFNGSKALNNVLNVKGG